MPPRLPSALAAAVLLLPALGALAASDQASDQAARRASEQAEDGTFLPEDWRTSAPIAFERWLDAALPGELAPETLAELRAELDAMGPAAVRAAAILGRSATARAHRVLLERLEARAAGSERASDAGDVVAAAAVAAGPLAREPERGRTRGRLAALAAGENPHPDLEVRVECAARALDLGEDATIPFLLRVLRIDTRDGLADPRPWADVERSAWARDRAAAALSRRAGLPVEFRADAPLADRERAADALERALL